MRPVLPSCAEQNLRKIKHDWHYFSQLQSRLELAEHVNNDLDRQQTLRRILQHLQSRICLQLLPFAFCAFPARIVNRNQNQAPLTDRFLFRTTCGAFGRAFITGFGSVIVRYPWRSFFDSAICSSRNFLFSVAVSDAVDCSLTRLLEPSIIFNPRSDILSCFRFRSALWKNMRINTRHLITLKVR